MNREFGRILAGDTSVDDAFTAIEADSNELLAKFAQTQG
jgi:sn-glycerol 3-phosphate transport system substrate-binding protein